MGARIASLDPVSSSLGPVDGWPALLCSSIDLMLACDRPMCLAWGAGRVLLYNDAFVPLLAERHPAALGRPVLAVWGDAGERVGQAIDQVFAGQMASLDGVLPDATREGGHGLSLDCSPIRGEAGRVEGLLGVVADVSARLRAERNRARAEASLRQSELRFRALVNASSDVVYRMSPDWIEMRQLDGRGFISDTDTPSVRWLEAYIFAEDRDEVLATIGQAVRSRSVFELEHRVRRVDGSVGWTHSRAIPILDADGAIIEWFGMAADVSDRHFAAEKLRESDEAYRTLFNAMDSGFCLIEVCYDGAGAPVDLRFVEVNPAFARHSGLSDAAGRSVSELLPDLERAWLEIYDRIVRTGLAERFELGAKALGRWFDVNAFRIGAPGQHRVAVLFTDISDRHRSERALRDLNDSLGRRIAVTVAERQILADVVEGSDAIVEVVSQDYRWLAINRTGADAFERTHGPRPRVGDCLLDVLADAPVTLATLRALWARALGGEEFTVSHETDDPPPQRRYYETRFNVLSNAEGQRIGAYRFVNDVTERVREQARLREAEEALRQVQKLESIGQITGGVAHDVNNLLAPIFIALDVLQDQAYGGERERQLIAGAARSAERARTLVQRLLSFARRQPLLPTVVDLAALVSGMGELIASTMGPKVRLVVDVPHGLPPALVDANQLEMALLNLAVNSRDAMPDGGTLSITARSRRVEPGVVLPALRTRLAAGRYIWLSVADDGIGMDDATLARASEPFFSTKGVGKGTGLGLSMVEGLASQLQGAMAITSQRGVGTTVDLWLPEARGLPSSPEKTVAARVAAARGRVLLVDDEELVRTSIGALLTDLGYGVTQVASAEAALAVLETSSRFDLLITDQQMPGRTGSALVRDVRRQRPDLPVLLISGYADVDAVEPDLPRLAKPFRRMELIEALPLVLDRGAPRH